MLCSFTEPVNFESGDMYCIKDIFQFSSVVITASKTTAHVIRKLSTNTINTIRKKNMKRLNVHMSTFSFNK